MRKLILVLTIALLFQNSYAQIDRTKPPKAGPAPIIKINDPVITRLPNGITVLVVENHKLPRVTASYSIDAGPITEGNKAGLLDLTGAMLEEGTTVRSKASFDEAVDRMGANVNLSANGGSVGALTRYFDSAFFLMAEALKKPSFKQESFDKLKSQIITGLKSEEKSVTAVAGRVTPALAFGLTHPQGEFQTEASVNALTLNDAKQAYQKYITPSRGYLTFVGDITPAKAQALATKAFATWKGSPLQLEKLAMVPNPATTEVDLVDMPNAVQSEIRVTNLVSLPMSDPDYFAVLLANQVLGGGSESKLFMNLREKHGFTYGAYSNMGSGRFQTQFTASAAVRNAKTDSAVVEFLNEINNLRTQKVTGEELSLVKAKYNGDFALGLENPARIASFASNILINNLPKDFYRTYLQKINAVTAEDIQRVANKYFNRDNTRIIVTGKASEVADGLKKLGYPVKMFDKYAQPVAATASNMAAPSADTKTIINDYLKAIGGTDELQKVKSTIINMGMSMQGMTLDVQQKKMFPNMEVTTVKMGGNVVNKNLFDGTTGYQEQMGQKKEMSKEEIEEKKGQTTLFDQVDYLTGNYKLKVAGTEKIEGKDAYKVEVTLPGGKSQTEYYDTQSHFLVRLVKEVQANNMTIYNTITFGDYKKVGNIMFPHTQQVAVSANGQDQNFEMKVTDIKLNEGVTAADFK
ncbi:MAG: insulinase family protein [Chitinophagaceae bacterium]|nr:insulinase family protein [Chitinophagaceae bacterium]